MHFELLIRLKDENGKRVLPSVFLPAAERYSLTTLIDRWVVTNAFAGLRQMSLRAGRLRQCAINLSGHSLGSQDFLAFVLRELEDSGIAPQSICFEITETAVISNMSSARQFIQRMKREGVEFGLDDFGTGLSSFAYLRELEVDYLKIDGVFVKDIVRDPIQLAMVRSINDIGHVMGIRTVAEFVESQEVLEALKRLGVDHAQGFFLGTPRPASEIFCDEKIA